MVCRFTMEGRSLKVPARLLRMVQDTLSKQ